MTLLKELANQLGVFVKPLPKAAVKDDGLSNDLMQFILEIRAEARKSKNFALSDKIRDRLAALKITVEDRPEGPIWKRAE
jgi:cysteinyl-tRNA synthetase